MSFNYWLIVFYRSLKVGFLKFLLLRFTMVTSLSGHHGHSLEKSGLNSLLKRWVQMIYILVACMVDLIFLVNILYFTLFSCLNLTSWQNSSVLLPFPLLLLPPPHSFFLYFLFSFWIRWSITTSLSHILKRKRIGVFLLALPKKFLLQDSQLILFLPHKGITYNSYYSSFVCMCTLNCIVV